MIYDPYMEYTYFDSYRIYVYKSYINIKVLNNAFYSKKTSLWL